MFIGSIHITKSDNLSQECLNFWAEWRVFASGNYATIGSDNGLSPVRHQATIWTKAGLLLTGSWGQTSMKFENKVILI